MRTFRRLEDLPHDADSLAEFARRSSLFVVTSERVLFCDGDQQLVELSRSGQLAFSFMIDNRQALAPVVDAATRYAQALDRGRPRNRATLTQILDQVSVA